MVRNHRRQGFLFLVPLLLASFIVITPIWGQAATPRHVTSHISKPHQLIAQSGAGSTEMKSFRVSVDPWQIHWSYSCPSDQSATDNGLIVRIVRNGTPDGGAAVYETNSSGSGVTTPMTGKGKFALNVLTECPWTLTVDQNSGTLPPKPANTVFMEMGFGAANTPTFRVTHGPWLIKWNFVCPSGLTSGDDGFRVTVTRNGRSDGAPEVSLSNASGYGQTGPMLGVGRFSFNVLTDCSWTLYSVQHANGQHASQQLGSAGAAGSASSTTTTAPNQAAGTPSSAASQPSTASTPSTPPSTASCAGQMDCCPSQNTACTPPVITYDVGQTGTLSDGGQVQLATITVSAPTFSTTDANGDTPQFGEFATFTVTVTDTAPSSDQNETIDATDSDFYIQLPNGQRYGLGIQSGVQNGNSGEAAGPNELGTNSVGGLITLSPGQSTTGTVTIDMPGTSGQLYYSGGGQIDGAWSF